MEQVYRIGIDRGYGNIKSAHYIFESGVIERERASELAGAVAGVLQGRRPVGGGGGLTAFICRRGERACSPVLRDKLLCGERGH